MAPYAMMTGVRVERGRTEAIVGREAELAALLRSATPGSGRTAGRPGTRMVLLSGDAGVGKTRLTTEALDRLAADGWTCLVGHCLDFGEVAMPYLPFTEVLGQLAEREPELAEEMVARHPALARLRRPSGSDETAESLDRAEVFEAVHALLDELSARAAVVLVVEDAHWADTSTRDLLSFLLSRRFRGRFLALVTYRSDEMHRRHPLRRRVSEWVRVEGVDRVQLDPLPPSAVRALVTDLIGGPSSEGGLDEQYDDDVTRIVQRAQGNAFYVEELVAAFLGGGWSLPEDFADLLLVRLDRLDEQSRDVVRVASAAGQRVSHELLGRVAPVDEEQLEAALRTAIDAHVLVRTGQSEYAFRHALLGEAVYDDLLPGERMRLHTAYAGAVRELLGKSGSAELARHALASHDLPAALLASVEAGDLAMADGGPEEAARHFTRSLEIYERAAAQLGDPPDEAELVARTVDALCSAGRPETAVSLAESHLRRFPSDGPDVARARLLLARAEALRLTESPVRLSEVTEEALSLVGPEPSPLRARIMALHAQAMIFDDRFGDARSVADEAIELAERMGLPRLSADVGMTLTWLNQHLDLGDGSRAELRRIIEDAHERGDSLSEMRGHLRTGGVELEYGDLRGAEEAFLTATRVAESIGRPWTPMGISGRTQAAIVAFMRGDWDRALEIADHSKEDPPPTPRGLLDAAALLVAAGRGEVAALSRLPAVRERWHRDGMIVVNAGGAAIELMALRDGAAAAVAVYDDVMAVLTPLWGPTFDAVVRLAAQAMAALGDEAPRTPTRSRDDVLATADRLVADAARVEAGREADERPFGIEGRAWSARLEAERLRLGWLLGTPVDLAALVEQWRTTVGLFGELGHGYEEARARARLALVLRATGETDAAREEAATARAYATGLGARPLLEELGGAARNETGADLLTAREHEILDLVATGRSNAEIGQQLFISAKTVSVHVSNVMAKLGAASRTEAVALARQSGLLSR